LCCLVGLGWWVVLIGWLELFGGWVVDGDECLVVKVVGFMLANVGGCWCWIVGVDGGCVCYGVNGWWLVSVVLKLAKFNIKSDLMMIFEVFVVVCKIVGV